MKRNDYSNPHRLLIFESLSSGPSQDLIVQWKNGRLRNLITGEAIVLKPHAEAVLSPIHTHPEMK